MPQKNEKQFYLGNTNLPRPEATFDYASNPQWIKDIQKCTKNILYFAENFFYIVNLDQGKIKIELFSCQKRVLRSLRDNRFVVLLASRQIGKTTLMTIYALWLACFHEDQRILIVANKEQTAINIFKRVRIAYEQLPNYLKPGTVEYGKTSMTLGNGSSIGISTTSSDAGRGESVNCVILDELAFIDNHLVEEFWKSVYPIISSSKKSKIFIASTPNGTGNLFHEIYTGALEGKNGWKSERVDWWEIPGRDETWKELTIRSIGSKDAFDQEYGNVFFQSGESSINDLMFDKLKLDCFEPKFVYDEGRYHLWAEPKQDSIYVVGVDVSEGVGEAASVVQILDITDLKNIEQVAIYYDKNTSPYNFTSKLHEILKHWGSPLALIERNNCGAQVVDQLKFTLGYENIVSYGTKTGQSEFKKVGISAHTNTKYKGVMNMRYWINELNSLRIRDVRTLQELRDFVRYPNGTWAAKPGADLHDDRVMSLIWALIILENELAEKFFEILELDSNKKPLRIKALDFGIKYFVNPGSIYNNEKEGGGFKPLPIVMPSQENDQYSDIQELESQGWKRLN